MDEIKEQIRRIKYLRMKPEERFLSDILTKVEKGYNDDHPKSTFFSLNGMVLFEQDDKTDIFWSRYDKIWHVLEEKYYLDYDTIHQLIINMVLSILKIKVTKPLTKWVNGTLLIWDKLELNKNLNK